MSTFSSSSCCRGFGRKIRPHEAGTALVASCKQNKQYCLLIPGHQVPPAASGKFPGPGQAPFIDNSTEPRCEDAWRWPCVWGFCQATCGQWGQWELKVQLLGQALQQKFRAPFKSWLVEWSRWEPMSRHMVQRRVRRLMLLLRPGLSVGKPQRQQRRVVRNSSVRIRSV